MPVSVTNALAPKAPAFNRAAIKDKYVTIMKNGKPMAVLAASLSDETLRNVMRLPANKNTLADGWGWSSKGQIVQQGLKTPPKGPGIVTDTHVDPRPRPIVAPPAPVVSTTPNPGPGTPAPITTETDIPGGGSSTTNPDGSTFTTTGGNRTNKHVVGGAGSRLGYLPGRMLNRARQVYAGAVEDGPNNLGHYGTFSGAPSKAPGQASLNQMHRSSMGQVTNMGQADSWHRASGGPVAQQTVLPNKGQTFGSAWQDYKKPTAGIHPANGVNNSDVVEPTSPLPNTATGTNNEDIKTGPVDPGHAGPGAAAPRPNVATGANNEDPATGGQTNSNQQHSAMVQNWKVGDVYQGRSIVGGTWLVRPGGRRVYVPIINTTGDIKSKTAIHPAWAGLRN